MLMRKICLGMFQLPPTHEGLWLRYTIPEPIRKKIRGNHLIGEANKRWEDSYFHQKYENQVSISPYHTNTRVVYVHLTLPC